MTLLKIKMDSSVYEEIRSELARVGRRDLLDELNDAVDPDWRPVFSGRRDSLSDDEGSATSEEEYEVNIDKEGFQSIK